MEIKNLKKAAERIIKAVTNKENIILYGDADLDGVASVIILKEAIQNLGGQAPHIYFLDREEEEYGLNKTALDYLKQFSPALLITLDCGVSNFEEVKLAKKLKLEVLVVDHHEVLKKLPAVKIIVNPKQKGDRSSFKQLATAGIVFKLVQLILKEKLTQSLKNSFLELAALATIADMMPEEEDNKTIVAEGLASLKETWRPGLQAFFDTEELKKAASTKMIAQKIIAALNIADAQEHLNATYLVLTSPSLPEAQKMAENLFEKRRQKQETIKRITEEAEGRAMRRKSEPLVFEGDASWPRVLLGAVASRLFNKLQKPTFIFKKTAEVSKGSVRTPKDLNSVELMEKCAKCLLTYGGHARASGFTVKNENLEKFRSCLIEYLENR